MNKNEIKKHYLEQEEKIRERVSSFKKLKEEASEERLFEELVFVILTSQSDAKKCWECARKLENSGLLADGSEENIADVIEEFDIQYSRNKAKYILYNLNELSQPSFANPEPELNIRNKISENNVSRTREWMVENLKGVSWKGSSHFLRNIGFGLNFAVLSKPLMTSMHNLGRVENPSPPSNREEYLKIEQDFISLAEELELRPVDLDLTLWSMETGEVFK